MSQNQIRVSKKVLISAKVYRLKEETKIILNLTESEILKSSKWLGRVEFYRLKIDVITL